MFWNRRLLAGTRRLQKSDWRPYCGSVSVVLPAPTWYRSEKAATGPGWGTLIRRWRLVRPVLPDALRRRVAP